MIHDGPFPLSCDGLKVDELALHNGIRAGFCSAGAIVDASAFRIEPEATKNRCDLRIALTNKERAL